MVNYANGKIYRIVCNTTGKQYIGSTTRPLSERLNGHKNDLNKYLKGNRKKGCTSFEIINGGNYSIILIENVECKSKEELLSKERYYIESMSCVNKIIPLRSNKEYKEDNKEKIRLNKREYRIKNKDKIKEQRILYDQVNKDKLSNRRKTYRINNLHKLTEPFICACGVTVQKKSKSRHLKTLRHIAYLESLKNND